MKTTLSELREFKNEAVVHRFLETWDLPVAEAEELFEEMKKWLWLNAYLDERSAADRFPLAISQSTKLIDEMWHTFILFTKDYEDFCARCFGHLVHHQPTPRSAYDVVIAEYEREPDAVIDRNRELFARQYELIFDVLGEDTLVKWYDEYQARYTDEFMRRIWRWSFSPYDSRVRESVRLAPAETSPGAP